ncbi:hypothetical protein ACJ41O_006363 [Fusarium nematophilum]
MRSDEIGPEAEKPAPATDKTISSRGSFNTSITDVANSNSQDKGEEQVHDEVLQLARRLTTQSHRGGASASLFPLAQDGPLDPNSPKFNAKQWAKAFFKARTESLEGTPPKTTGVAFKNLSVYGFGSDTDFQKSVGNVLLEAGTMMKNLVRRKQQRVDILHDLEGVVHAGEMLCVLGPPGSGCSTFLKTIAGDTHGFHIEESSSLNYQGIHPDQIKTAFRGEAIYTAEVDHHFPQLTVGDTLSFAAAARCPKTIPSGVTRSEYVDHLRDVTMAMFGISHTKNTRVGDDFIRGVSGGERKRVTIAEASLSYSPLQCWDNSTRGLDSANAVEFCRTLRTQADVMGCTSCVAIYQAPQDAYDVFEKVLVLYKGRQIFFGKAARAKEYFEELGFICPGQQTTADFLTSMTSPSERIVRPGWEDKTPRSPEEFSQVWKQSRDRALLLEEIEDYVIRHPFHGEHYDRFLESRRMDQSSAQRSKSPFTLSYLQQMRLTMWRSFVLLKTDPSLLITMLITNFLQAIIVSSIFYNLPETTQSFQSRAILLFFLILMNAFASILEIINLYAKRKIIEKHARYALYHPSAEALSSMVVDLPYKIVNSIFTNVAMYFMGNLRREPGAFFFFLLYIFFTTLTMSMLFRLIGSVTKSIAQAMAPSAIILLGLILYTGFTIPTQYMRSWISWSRWANPLFYGLESVMINEFAGRDFPCSSYIPFGAGYDDVAATGRACSAQGSIPGQDLVSGTAYIKIAYGYDTAHRWRNFGVMIAFMILYMALHLVATEYVASERSKGEVLVYVRKAMKHLKRSNGDIESGQVTSTHQQTYDGNTSGAEVEKQTAVFHWKDVCYDIKIKGEPRRILDQVDGWVKPGTLTALMGSSGAGKTTLLDVLASRVTMGVVTGDMLVNGKLRDESFQRKTGYVQQQDLHLHTSTVREALAFSALLRQPSHYSRQEKLDYVDTVIGLLNMEEYADAIIGVPGEGLNVEQRKRLTIGVELAARPQLLLFFDEPTSGLDSQTSWSICNLMEKLTKNGQAILCTIHQPSAMLFQRFDRLLLLSKGKTIYFGDIGKNAKILVDYFTRNGAHELPDRSNPAEYMLEVIGAAPGATTDIDWPAVWRSSPEYQGVQEELGRLANSASGQPTEDASVYKEFAASALEQHTQVTKRVFQQYWRSPGYIYSKILLAVGSSLFIGLSFLDGDNTQRGLLNQMFGVFIFLSVFPQLVNQIMPVFAAQRTMYEARERPSKAYSWKSFMSANIVVELAWNSLLAVFCYVCWYYPIGLYKNAEWTDSVHSRGFTMFLHLWIFFMFSSTFANMMIAGIPTADMAGGAMNLLLIMMFTFCGVLAGPDALPGFWIFMYRVNPFTYIIESFLGTSLGGAPMYCESNEYVPFVAPNGTTCGEYAADFLSQAGGYLADSDTTDCRYCAMSDTNTFLASVNVSMGNRWRDFGFMWVYCIFNIAMAFVFYWLARVPKNKKAKKDAKPFRVAIIGGGIAGITLAISLLKRNVPCIIYEQAHTFGEGGAGLGSTSNAARAMSACDPSIYEAFEKVVNGNLWESKHKIHFELVDGMDSSADVTPRLTIESPVGLQGCHRGHFINELLQLLPDGVALFNKQLERIEEPKDGDFGKLRIYFHDGTVAEADAVIGCDGIKSRTRELLFGQDHPSAKCSYTHKYAYRGMIPMNQVVEVLGEERSLNATLWMGKNMHMITYPVAHGTICNLVAYCTSAEDWPSETQLTLPAQEGKFLEDFKGFKPLLLELIKMAQNLDRWGIFDLGDNPVPTFARGRVCISGDAAHATSPHQGAGAGYCIEDSAVLASLLADERVQTSADVKTALTVFDRSRRGRAQWLVQHCRWTGNLYEYQTEVGNDFERMEKELKESFPIIWNFSIEDAIADALDDLGTRLSAAKGRTESGLHGRL